MANPCIQIGLWPSPRGYLSVADARAIKVSGCHYDFSDPITADRRPLTGIVDRWMDVLQTIFSSRLKFPKPVVEYKLLNFFGRNVLTSEFAEWKQHRKIVAPAFSEVRHLQLGTHHPMCQTIACRKTTSSPSRNP